jgi:REP element-mobilizing transposase RayT
MRGICADLDAELVEFNGEADHVHLLVAYPPTLAICVLAQRLKGRTAHAVRREFTGACVRARMRGHLWSPSYFASPVVVHRCRSSSNTSTDNPDRSQRPAPPGDMRDGLTPD